MWRRQRQADGRDLRFEYELLTRMWSSGWSEYHSLAAGFIAGNALLLNAAVLLLQAGKPDTGTLPCPPGPMYADRVLYGPFVAFWVSAAVLSLVGVFVAVQMRAALGKCACQTGYFAWRLRVIELKKDWKHSHVFDDLWMHLEGGDPPSDKTRYSLEADVPGVSPWAVHWAARHHRRWWAKRMGAMWWVFAGLYVLPYVGSAFRLSWAYPAHWLCIATAYAIVAGVVVVLCIAFLPEREGKDDPVRKVT